MNIELLVQQAPETQLEDYLRDIGPGLIMEFGVYQGKSITRIANVNPSRTVYGFDSFQGLPEKWNNYPIGKFECKVPKVPSNVVLVEGWFDQTIPPFCEEHKDELIAFMHIDCDLYSSTKTIFDNFKPMIGARTIIAFDELLYYNSDEWKQHEYKAFQEFLNETKYKVKCIGRHGRHQAAFQVI